MSGLAKAARDNDAVVDAARGRALDPVGRDHGGGGGVTGRILAAVAGIAVAGVLAVASLPWVLLAIGAGVMGDDALSDRIADSAPFSRFLDWRAS